MQCRGALFADRTIFNSDFLRLWPDTLPALVKRFISLLSGQPDAETTQFLPLMFVFLSTLYGVYQATDVADTRWPGSRSWDWEAWRAQLPNVDWSRE